MRAIDAIYARRSSPRLLPPELPPSDLETVIKAALTAPDHGRLRPFYFVILEGEAKQRFGRVLRDAYIARCSDAGIEPDPARAEKERTKLDRAPTVVVAAARRRADPKIPWAEQAVAVAAAVQNLLISATALGYGSMWRTGDPAYDPRVKAALGLRNDDAIVGFIYLGHPAVPLPPRQDTSDLYADCVWAASPGDFD